MLRIGYRAAHGKERIRKPPKRHTKIQKPPVYAGKTDDDQQHDDLTGQRL
jgi:hypothetical protein